MDKQLSKEHIFKKCFLSEPHIPLTDSAFEAMDIYSKQKCLELIKFMYASCAETIPNTRPAKWNIDLNTEVTFEELYQAFLNQQ